MPNILRKLAAAALLAIGVFILAFVIQSTDNAGNKDFISYWAAGQLLRHHANPYDSEGVYRLERSAGFHADKPLVMRNPPNALILAFPLGLTGPKTGVIIWSLLLVVSIVLSVHLLWALYGHPPDRLHLFGYMFAPTLACLRLGQTTALILLGLVLFLRWRKRRPVAAGACLAMAAMKPHLFVPFALVLLLWIIITRNYKIVLGGAGATIAALAFPIWLDPALCSHYLPVLKQAGAESQIMPTISAMLRLVISPHAGWGQFVPATLGCIWALTYYYRRRQEWDWKQHGPALLVVSLLVAPYSWLSDEIVVMPAMLQAIFRSAATGRSFMGFVVLNGIALVGMLFGGITQDSGFYLWTPIAWAGWYVWAVSRTSICPAARVETAAERQA